MSSKELMELVDKISATPQLQHQIKTVVAELCQQMIDIAADCGCALTEAEAEQVWTDIFVPSRRERRKAGRVTTAAERERSERTVRRHKLARVLQD